MPLPSPSSLPLSSLLWPRTEEERKKKEKTQVHTVDTVMFPAHERPPHEPQIFRARTRHHTYNSTRGGALYAGAPKQRRAPHSSTPARSARPSSRTDADQRGRLQQNDAVTPLLSLTEPRTHTQAIHSSYTSLTMPIHWSDTHTRTATRAHTRPRLARTAPGAPDAGCHRTGMAYCQHNHSQYLSRLFFSIYL